MLKKLGKCTVSTVAVALKATHNNSQVLTLKLRIIINDDRMD